MTPERWSRIEALFHAATRQAPDARQAFLAQACRGDDALHQEVAALLAEDVSGEGFADGPTLRVAPGVLADHAFESMAGERLGGYRLEALLGRGGMGEVYRANDPKLGRDVAIKILPRAFTSSPERLARFDREARMLAALNHPNICAIYGLETAAGVHFLVLELVEGLTLAETLAARPSDDGLPVADAIRLARQICAALEVAHEKRIMHRDLKPANIMITPQGVAKVLDFGLARPLAPAGSPALTAGPDERQGGAVLGTAAYMSPEQARGLPVDTRTDIWAFGCVLYEMLSGRAAFTGDTASDVIARILEREPIWSDLPASTPPAVRRLLTRCLAKDPTDRLRDIADARFDLEPQPDGPPESPERRGFLSRRAAAVLGGATLALGILAATLLWLAADPPLASIQNRLAAATYSFVTEWDGSELDAAISADGKFAAFVADPSGPFHIWLTQLGTGVFRNLTPGDGDERNRLNRPVGFSADGSSIWISGSPQGRRLRVMPFTGGPFRPFLEDHAISTVWSPDDTRLLYLRADEDGDPLMVGGRSGDNVRQVLAGKAGEHAHFPTWSVDGAWIYYVHFVDEPISADLWRVPSSGGAPERITHVYRDVRYPTPIDRRTVLYVALDERGAGPWLWAVDVETKARTRINVGPNRYLSIAASADGRRLIATVSKSRTTLASVPVLDRPADERDAAPFPVAAARARAPRFGGEALFFLSSNGSGDGLWREQDGRLDEVWKASEGVLSDPVAVASTGRLAVALRAQGRTRLVVVSADGAERQTVAEGLDVRGTAAWSPDGRWIVTGGRDARGPGLFKIPVDGGEPVRLAAGHALDPVWSPDGTLIVYAGPLAKATAPLRAIRPDGREVPLPPMRTHALGGGCVRFMPDGRGFVYMQGRVGAQAFWLFDLASQQSRQLARLSGAATVSTFDITSDGRRIVFDQLRELADIVLIELPG